MNLHLEGNYITDIQSIGDALKNNTFKELFIHENNITDSGILSLVDALKTSNTLYQLDLHNNKLSETMKWQLKDICTRKRSGSPGYQQIWMNPIKCE